MSTEYPTDPIAQAEREEIVKRMSGLRVVSAPTVDRLRATGGVVIPLAFAVVCGEEHVYDSREWESCPNCLGAERWAVSSARPIAEPVESERPRSHPRPLFGRKERKA